MTPNFPPLTITSRIITSCDEEIPIRPVVSYDLVVSITGMMTEMLDGQHWLFFI